MTRTTTFFGDFCFISEDVDGVFSGPGNEARVDFFNDDSNYWYFLTANGGVSNSGDGGAGIVDVTHPTFEQFRTRLQISATAYGGSGSTGGGDAIVSFHDMEVETPTLSLSGSAFGQVGSDGTDTGNSSVSISGNLFTADSLGTQNSFIFQLSAVPADSTASGSMTLSHNVILGSDQHDGMVIMFTGMEGYEDQIDSLMSYDQILLGAGDDYLSIISSSALAPTFDHEQIDGGDGFDQLVIDTFGGINLDLFNDGFSGFERVDTADYKDTVWGDETNNIIFTHGDDDKLYGQGGDDVLAGGAGNDELDGGIGNDTADFADSSYSIVANLALQSATGDGNDTLLQIENLIGSNSDDQLTGDGFDNHIEGALGNDELDGGFGNDILAGDLGDDVLDGNVGIDWADYSNLDSFFSNDGVTVDLRTTEQQDTGLGGLDTLTGIENVRGSLDNDHLIGDAGINSLLGDLGDDLLEGLGGADIIEGGAGADVIDGGNGIDQMSGGVGDDTFYVDASADIVIEYNVAGTDFILSSADYALTGWVENLQLVGSADLDARGNNLANVLTGNDGSNQLDGFGGADQLIGGKGDDVYYVDDGNDNVIEVDGEGYDTIVASVSYAIPTGVDALTLADREDPFGLGNFLDNLFGGIFDFSNDTTGYGNELDNVLIGNSGSNKLFGLAGDDLLNGGAGVDTMKGGSGDDTYVVDNSADIAAEISGEGIDLVQSSATYAIKGDVENLTLIGDAAVNGTGNSLDNVIVGNSAANIVNGGTGADSMRGGDGDDTYIVDNAGDRAVETSLAGGIDTVKSTVSFILGANVENLTLMGTDPITAKGNSLGNIIYGNSVANVIDGGAGADSMRGGGGSDTYIVDNAGDRAVETSPTGGADLVKASVSFTLGTNVENLTLTGTANINGKGNIENNVITGNSGANVLDGGLGADSLRGGLGSDTYIVDNSGDRAIESAGGGVDTVKSSVSFTLGANVEKLVLTGLGVINGKGNELDNSLYGSGTDNIIWGLSGNDTISAGIGNDRLYGGAGNDRLTGGEGTDRFYFDSALGASNIDRITDFNSADDSIVLSRTVFSAFAANGVLSAAAFHNGTEAQDPDDRIIYDSTTGNIYYDADGSGAGAAVLFAQVNPSLAITNADFLIAT